MSDEESALRRIDVMVCEPCMEGEGDVCWTPGCVFWACDVPLVTDALRHCVLATVQPTDEELTA